VKLMGVVEAPAAELLTAGAVVVVVGAAVGPGAAEQAAVSVVAIRPRARARRFDTAAG
jgi:hypothetical protein